MQSSIDNQQQVSESLQLERIEGLLSEIRSGLAPKLWVRLVHAAVQGFGYILGATVLILVLTSVMRPFSRLEIIGDKFERAIEALEQRER